MDATARTNPRRTRTDRQAGPHLPHDVRHPWPGERIRQCRIRRWRDGLKDHADDDGDDRRPVGKAPARARQPPVREDDGDRGEEHEDRRKDADRTPPPDEHGQDFHDRTAIRGGQHVGRPQRRDDDEQRRAGDEQGADQVVRATPSDDDPDGHAARAERADRRDEPERPPERLVAEDRVEDDEQIDRQRDEDPEGERGEQDQALPPAEGRGGGRRTGDGVTRDRHLAPLADGSCAIVEPQRSQNVTTSNAGAMVVGGRERPPADGPRVGSLGGGGR